MQSPVYTTNVSVCEGLSANFDLLELLLSADPNYSGTDPQALVLFVQDSEGNYVEAPPGSYLQSVDGDTVAVDLGSMPDFHGSLSFRILATDSSFELITITVDTQIVPVNDAPEGSDGGTTVAAGEAYVFAEADFGFSDPVDGDNFLGVRINTLPAAGRLQLDGAELVAGQEVSTADINAGKLAFVPDPGQSGEVTIDFQVRDDGGVNECGGDEFDLTPNTFTITMPSPEPAQIGDRVWLDCDGDGIQDADEPGAAGVAVQLLDANGSVVATTTTDSNGAYLFGGLTPGAYALKFDAPSGLVFSPQDQGGNEHADSDANASGMTVHTTLEAGEADLSWDAGLMATPRCLSFDFSGDSSTNGKDGNIRTYTVDGVTVNVSAWAQSKSSGNFSDAWMGAYRDGLGVTDDSEGSGSGDRHTVDNLGDKHNYVLFEFSQSVVIDRAYLGYVDDDSDIEIWIGTVDDPIGNHLDLNASVLSGLGLYEYDGTTSSSARWADFNAGEVAGNVLVIAADTTDRSPEDEFKIEKLDLCTSDPCGPIVPTEPVWVTFDFSGDSSRDGSNGNIRTYTVDGVTVNVSAFSESRNGHFNTAYLGAYNDGLGVTDDSEGSGSSDTHTVDNVHWNNYLVFEFSHSVVIDKAYLGDVVNDSDMEVWIGTVTDPIGNHVDLNSSLLSSLGLHEFDQTNSSNERWADFNAGEVAGNVLVIAADTTDSTPEDRFKLEKLALCTSNEHTASQPASAAQAVLAEGDLAALGTLLDDGDGSLDALVGPSNSVKEAADGAPLTDSYTEVASMNQLADVYEQALAA